MPVSECLEENEKTYYLVSFQKPFCNPEASQLVNKDNPIRSASLGLLLGNYVRAGIDPGFLGPQD